MYRKYIKQTLSYFFAFILLLLLLPVLLCTAIILLVFNGGKVFYIQRRTGKNGTPFHLIKFRTMRDTQGPGGELLPDSQRQFRLGNFIRDLHLDELPQLLNILKGDLNIVGPRPLLPEYLAYYPEEYVSRHSCKPGMTGLAQVMGGNELDWDSRLQYDCQYAKNITARQDLSIILLTIRVLFIKVITPSSQKRLYSQSYIEYLNEKGRNKKAPSI